MRLAVCISHLHLIKLLLHLQRDARGERAASPEMRVLFQNEDCLKQLLHFTLNKNKQYPVFLKMVYVGVSFF